MSKPSNKKRRSHIHLKRVQVTLTSADHSQVLAQGRVILNDLGVIGVHLYTNIQIPTDTSVVMVFEDPRKLALRAQVLWCQESVPASHILSANAYRYQMNVMFHFEKTEERNELVTFMEEIAGQFLYRNYGISA